MECPVCIETFKHGDFNEISEHFTLMSNDNDSEHISWLNNNISKTKLEKNELSKLFKRFYSCNDIKLWIINKFIEQFRGERPHPFILMMQDYNPRILKGYSFEHYFFLKQWVRSCSSIIASTDIDEIQNYEIENILSEYYGHDNIKPHIELLLEMAESYDIKREDIYNSRPLPKTEMAIKRWQVMSKAKTAVEMMAAMHSLELIANNDLRSYGAKYDYFNLKMLESSDVPDAVKSFLMEGYKADSHHSIDALDIINKYNSDIEGIQDSYLESAFVFSKYLEARIERGEIIEDKQQ